MDLLNATSVNDTSVLEESVTDSIKRDLKMVGDKLKIVLVPRDNNSEETLKELRNWDLWGPLILCLFLACQLAITSGDQAQTVFATIFIIFWCGAAVVTLNTKLLGATISFFQSLCVLGYSLFPMIIMSLLVAIWSSMIYRLVMISIGFAWSTKASVVFISQMIPRERTVLAVYPVLLFYFAIGWIIILQ
eukprot:TRINITY_DN1698_c2_g1_i1.p1 TRINITY_DN1698_c2_g1~~TRINITY_DN1698_c2_g1_i1.p1  ORF type:complete len:190 (-),score=28.33 TRINITY_DN1698_c2_g1_i1:100-669(-)